MKRQTAVNVALLLTVAITAVASAGDHPGSRPMQGRHGETAQHDDEATPPMMSMMRMMADRCKGVTARRHQGMAEMQAMDERLADKVTAMHDARGKKKIAAMEAVLDELLAQRQRMRHHHLAMADQMSRHQAEHMGMAMAGMKHSMEACSMMAAGAPSSRPSPDGDGAEDGEHDEHH